jgi:hypothetical protein
MTICPVALAIGCKKCPVVSVCPGKSIIGDYTPPSAEKKTSPKSAANPKSGDKS